MEDELERSGELRIMKHLALENWNVRKEDLHNTPDRKLQKVKEGEIWWVGIGENVGIETAVLSQARVFSVSRLYGRIGQAPDSDLEKVRTGLLDLLSK